MSLSAKNYKQLIKQEKMREMMKHLSSLIQFSFILTGNERDAKILIRNFVTEVAGDYQEFNSKENHKIHLFRILYRQFMKDFEGRTESCDTEQSIEQIEDFFLYKRLEENKIDDEEHKLTILSILDLYEAEVFFTALPSDIRPVIFLHYTDDFTYQQICDILCIKPDMIVQKVRRANMLFQAVVWQLYKKQQHHKV